LKKIEEKIIEEEKKIEKIEEKIIEEEKKESEEK